MTTKKPDRSPSRSIRPPRRRGPSSKRNRAKCPPPVYLDTDMRISEPTRRALLAVVDAAGRKFADTPLGRSQREIREECDAVRDVLLEKNRAYGDSAINPVRIFSKASAEEQILVRLDDKLSRLARGHAAGEDVTLDLIGYLVLLRVARKRHAAEALPSAPKRKR